MGKKEELEKIAEEISACEKCSLCKTRTNTVPGSGDFEAEVLFIGEAPGQKEDESGIPFCGAAGKFLDEMLLSIGLDREKVFIANTLKCRPPENRDPSDEEKALCRPFLDAQVGVLKPKLIVCMGKHSVANFMPGAGGISQLHGKAVRRPSGQVYLALYHPAAALHNGGLRQTLKDDFAKIPVVLKKIKDLENTTKINMENVTQDKLF